LPGVSERIRVRAVIDRFLEHARIFYFENGGEEEVYCSSADWMPRNFRRRVEVMYPIVDEALKQRVIHEILFTMRDDGVKSWLLRPDGPYERASGPGGRSQSRFIELARERARENNDAILGIAKPATPSAPKALDKLRRHAGKKRKRQHREE
jgi:polyphosphate kinase